MSQHLSATTHLVKIGEDVVVLDTRTKTYFCLAAAAEAICARPEGIIIEDRQLAREFEQAGLLVDTPAGDLTLPPVPAPRRDLGLDVAPRLEAGDILLILAAWATMPFSYHFVRFDRIVACAQRDRRSTRPVLGDELAKLVAAFERMLPWLPFQGVCLYRSFLLLRVLRWRGHDARWVFGVRTWPFHAHCWLQIGDVVLDDTADRLEGLTPIMVV